MSLSRQQNFHQLTKPWRDRVYSVAMRRASSTGIAEDWLQETMLRAWRDIDSLHEQQAIYAWLLKILDRVIADDTRRETRRQQLAPVLTTDDLILRELPSSKPGPFEQMVKQQTDELILAAIKQLPDEFSSVILLRDIEALSYREVADILDIPQGTVMSRLSRGRRLLSSYFIKQEGTTSQHTVRETQK